MKLPATSRLVAAGVLVALVPAAWLADAALRRAQAAAVVRAGEERLERGRQAGLALLAEIAAIEKDAAAGRARPGVSSRRIAAPLRPRLSVRPSPLPGLSRADLIVRASSRDVSPQGLPLAVPAALLIGDPRVTADVTEALLEGRLPVNPDDLPGLAAALGAEGDARVPALASLLREVPAGLPRVPEFRRTARGVDLEGWSRDGDDLLHWTSRLDPQGAGLAGDGDPHAVPVPGVEGLALVATRDDTEPARLSRLRLLSALAFAGVGALALGGCAALARDEARLRRERAFLASVTHELRTPVTAVRLLGETLAEGRGDPVEYGRLVAGEAQRMEGLVERSLLAARTEERLEIASVRVDEVIARALALAEPLARRRGKRIDLVRQQPLPEASWDGEAIRQAISNLLDNALRHGGASIVVHASADGGMARVAVQDDGPGIVRRDRRRVFGRFERGSASPGGTGLGLWLVERVARAHGGRVELVTEEGRGCTFTLVLPLRPAAA